MPKGLKAAAYFENQSRLNFIGDIVKLRSVDATKNQAPDPKFAGDHHRVFFLEQDAQGQWKRVSLVEKYGIDVLNTMALSHKGTDVIDEIYELVEQGNLYFYNRGSDVPMQYKFEQVQKTNNYTVKLGEVKDDPRFDTINAQRKEQAQTEQEQYQQYRDNLAKQEVLSAFSKNHVLTNVETGRQRAHAILSLADPRPLDFNQDGEYTAAPVWVASGSRFSPDDMESIVLAACCSKEAADANTHKSLSMLSPEEKLLQTLGSSIHQDVLIGGRTGSVGTVVKTFEKGREIASNLISRDTNGHSTMLIETMMYALRVNIQASREQPSLDATMLRMYEQIDKMALMMDKHQLYDSYTEFQALKRESAALGKVARTYLDGEKAKQELLEAYNNGGFKSEEQRLNIIGRIEAQRYLMARDYQGKLQRESSQEYRDIAARQEALIKSDLPAEEKLLQDGRLMAERTRTAPMRALTQEVMDATANNTDISFKLRDYGLLTAEGQRLKDIKDPYQLIEAVHKLPSMDTKERVDAMVADLQDKQATRMDAETAKAFWNSLHREMGPDQFNPKVLETEFTRLVVLNVAEDGYRSTQPLLTALGYKNQKDVQVRSMDDAEMMEKIRDQIAQGNVFFYKRGGDVPHRISLDEDGAPTMSEEITKPAPLGLWVRFAHFITGGRAYRKEVEQYNQEMYFLEPDTIMKGFSRGDGEVERYNIALAQHNAQEEKKSYLTTAKTEYMDMSAAHSRAHNVLSLDEPATVSFAGNTPDYTGKKFDIPDGLKSLFTSGELDALCLAGIISPAAAQAHMDAGISSIKGTKPESTASVLEGHVYNDILVWGRYDSECFFPLVDAGRQVAADALNAYANNQPDQMAKLLGDAIRSTVLNGRFDEGVKSNAALASEMALRMVGMLEKNPTLKAKCGIDEETLEGYKQELNGLRLIGEAYDKAGMAQRKLADAVEANRTLTEAESREIAADMLTYRYLNAIQVNANSQAALKPEIQGLKLISGMNGKMQIDQSGKRINPMVPDEHQIPTNDYYLNAAELKDLDYEIKHLYTDPLRPVKELSNSTLEEIRGHVTASNTVTQLSQLTDPMALVRSLNSLNKSAAINNLVAEVNAPRKQEYIQQQEQQLQQLQDLADALNGVQKGEEPKPENQLENPQAQVPVMN